MGVAIVSAENVKAFVLRAQDDEELKAAMRSANSAAEIAALAAKSGHPCSIRELGDTYLELAAEDLPKLAVRRAGFRVRAYGAKHWFGWK